MGAGHHQSSLTQKDSKEFRNIASKYLSFMEKIFDLWWDKYQEISIREIVDTLKVINHKKEDCSFIRMPEESCDLAIITIQKNGDITTYSPEFAGTKSSDYNNFIVGNALDMQDLSEIVANSNYLAIKSAIDKGKNNCASSCLYYDLCGSAFLSNRYTETKKLENTESSACALHRQLLISLIIEKLKILNISFNSHKIQDLVLPIKSP